MSAYLSLSLPCSILFLNFLYKRLREGKKTSERARRGREGGKVPSWISSWIPLCQSTTDISAPLTPLKKKRAIVSKNAHFWTKTGNLFTEHNLATRVLHAHGPNIACIATLAMLLSERWGNVRTTKRVVVNIVVKGGRKYKVYKAPLNSLFSFFARIPHEKWRCLSRKQRTTQCLMCVQQKN